MDKEKEIEENIIKDMVKIADLVNSPDDINPPESIDYACAYFNAGYRKVPEGSIVLSDEEAERFRGQTLSIAKVKAQTRRETAKKILQELYGWDNKIDDMILVLADANSVEVDK